MYSTMPNIEIIETLKYNNLKQKFNLMLNYIINYYTYLYMYVCKQTFESESGETKRVACNHISSIVWRVISVLSIMLFKEL